MQHPPNLFGLPPETELFKYDASMVTSRLLDEENPYETWKGMLFVMAPSSQFYRDVLEGDGQEWMEDE